MPGPTSIEGYAIVSADGMLADANRRIPAAMVVKADQDFFQDSLDQAAVLVHGRHSHEGGGARAEKRRRLVVTTRVDALADDPADPHALLWNPKGIPLAQAWAKLGAPDGLLAVIGGAEVYGMFLSLGYDKFHLSQAPRVHIPGGRPAFPEVGPGRTVEDVLAGHGLKAGPRRTLDAAAAVTLVTWSR